MVIRFSKDYKIKILSFFIRLKVIQRLSYRGTSFRILRASRKPAAYSPYGYDMCFDTFEFINGHFYSYVNGPEVTLESLLKDVIIPAKKVNNRMIKTLNSYGYTIGKLITAGYTPSVWDGYECVEGNPVWHEFYRLELLK